MRNCIDLWGKKEKSYEKEGKEVESSKVRCDGISKIIIFSQIFFKAEKRISKLKNIFEDISLCICV